jgi:hypothetical protein
MHHTLVAVVSWAPIGKATFCKHWNQPVTGEAEGGREKRYWHQTLSCLENFTMTEEETVTLLYFSDNYKPSGMSYTTCELRDYAPTMGITTHGLPTIRHAEK